MSIVKCLGACLVTVSWTMPSVAANHVATELIAAQSRIAGGGEFRVGVRFRMPAHGHIYWSNPGDSGLPTDIEWDLPEGFKAGPLQWPAPSAFYDDFLKETSFGYEGNVILFATVKAPGNLDEGDSIILRAKATWLVCLDDGLCIPEDAALELTLSAGSDSAHSPEAVAFDAAAERVPRLASAPNLEVRVDVEHEPATTVRFTANPPWSFAAGGDSVRLFPDRRRPWKLGESSASVRVFEPVKAVDGPISGVVVCELVNKETGETRSVNVRIGNVSEQK